MTLPELAIRRHVTTLMLLVSIAVLGAVAVARLPLAFLPDMEEPEVFVRVPYPSASPDQVERMIARPLEDVLGSVGGLRQLYSRCSDDGATLRLEFSWDTDLYLARVEIWEKIDRVRRELPDDIGDIEVSDHWHSREADDPILEVRLSSEVDLSESYDTLERRIVRPLQRVPGVAQVRLDGVEPKEVLVNLRIADLELHQIDVRDVAQVLASNNFNESLGRIVEGPRRYTLRTLASFTSIDQIRRLVIRDDGLRLENVADVIYAQPPLEFGRHLDGKFAIGITVSAEAKANAVEVCAALEKRIAAMDDDPELRGVTFLTRFNQGKEIRRTLRELFFSGVFGAILASIVLYVFLRRFSTTVISVLSIPLSLVVTCGIVWVQGRNLNTLTLLGLIVGIGMLVDNAVVVIENIFRHQERGEDRKTAARRGSAEVSLAVIAATLTSVIVFLPTIFNKPSEMSIPLKEIGLTVCVTLLASLFVSQTLIPLATSWFIRPKPRPRERWMVWLEERYERLLRAVLAHRWLTLVIGIGTAASAVYPFLNIDVDFSRRRNSLYAEVRYDFSEDLSIDRREEVVTLVENYLEPYREQLMAKSIYSWWSDRYSMTRIYLKDGFVNDENVEKVRRRLAEILPQLPGIRLEIPRERSFWRRDRGKRVAFQIIGEDSEVLADLAEEARLRLDGIPGLKSSFMGNDQGIQELHIEPDRDLADRYGVTANDVGSSIGLTFRGRRLRKYRTADGEREMRLALDERETESLSQLRNLPLWTDTGQKVPLAAVANFHNVPGPKRIERENRLTSVWVGAEYEKGTREQYIPAVTAAMAAMEFPFGYSWSFGSWRTRQQEQWFEFIVNLGLALLLVFAVMASLFESSVRALALLVSLPFALTGAIWTLYLTGTDFDQPAAVGILLLIGVVVNNGIVMLEHVNNYQRQGKARLDAMLLGGRERLRPILMTALTTLLGLTPVVIQKPSLGGMYYFSMALVLMGGLALSTVLTLVFLPSTTCLVEDTVAAIGRPFARILRSRRSARAEGPTDVDGGAAPAAAT